MKKEILNETVNVVMDEQQMQQYVEDNIHMVPKNQRKKFETLTLEQKVKKIQFYIDIEKLRADAKIKNSVPTKVKELLEKRGTVDDAKQVIEFAQEFVDNFRQHQIEEIDKKIAELEQMKESI